MEEFNFSISEYEDYTFNYDHMNTVQYDHNAEVVTRVVTGIIIGLGLPLTLAAIYDSFSLVRRDHVAPIYVINLLISDLIHFCCMIGWVFQWRWWMDAVYYLYFYVPIVSVGFRLCIALERYSVITRPLWDCSRITVKTAVGVCVGVWTLPLVPIISFYPRLYLTFGHILPITILILPFPLFIFFLGRTLKALSASRVPADEKRRIVGALVLLLFTHTLLVLSFTIVFLRPSSTSIFATEFLLIMVFELSPLSDLVLCIFMRKGIIDKRLASVCCCIEDSSDVSTTATTTTTTTTTTTV